MAKMAYTISTSTPTNQAERPLFVTTAGRSAWFVGVLVLTVYVIFAMTLYLLPPAGA